jgi:hypothetical protein
VRSLRVADEPVRTSVEPYVDTVVVQQVDHRGREIVRYGSLVDHGHIRIGEESPVECRDGCAQSQRIHQHRHPAWRSPTRHGEEDPRLAELPHRCDGPVGQDLVLGDQSPVDIGKQQPNGVCFGHQPSLPRSLKSSLELSVALPPPAASVPPLPRHDRTGPSRPAVTFGQLAKRGRCYILASGVEELSMSMFSAV